MVMRNRTHTHTHTHTHNEAFVLEKKQQQVRTRRLWPSLLLLCCCDCVVGGVLDEPCLRVCYCGCPCRRACSHIAIFLCITVASFSPAFPFPISLSLSFPPLCPYGMLSVYFLLFTRSASCSSEIRTAVVSIVFRRGLVSC